jgi:6-pyruvoyltetrahydropterin/6-carboxytetrahydropterin synthase
VCERLHGHNYRVGATVAGAVDPATGFVVDFAVLKGALRRLADRMDHRVLVPTRNPALTIRDGGDRVAVDYEWPDWLVVARAHACLVPVVHTTAECLAEHFAAEVWDALEASGTRVDRLELEVEESLGQAATCRLDRATLRKE